MARTNLSLRGVKRRSNPGFCQPASEQRLLRSARNDMTGTIPSVIARSLSDEAISKAARLLPPFFNGVAMTDLGLRRLGVAHGKPDIEQLWPSSKNGRIQK